MNITNRRHQEFTVLTGNRRRAADRIGRTYPTGRTATALSAVGMTAKAIEPHEAEFLARRPPLAQAAKEILLVDPTVHSSNEALNVLRLLADVDVCRDFSRARERLLNQPPDLLITNVRLHEYNGLHLVHLATPHTRCVVYSPHDDLVLAREVQAAGAFYERSMRLSRSLAGYVNGVLPTQDRRDVSTIDRRRFPRGGRRSSDW
jgi:DNA-binding NarL/FixJ family response regulator